MSFFAKSHRLHAGRILFAIVTALLLASSLPAQDYLSLSGGSTAPGGVVSLDLTLSSAAGSEPAGVQWSFTYAPANIQSVSVVAGPAATAASKAVTCAGASGTYTCIASGDSATPIQTGTVAVATFQLASTVASSVPVNMTGNYGALGTGTAVGVTGAGAVITVLSSPVLSTFSCTPASLTAPGTVSCSVGLTSPAPASGITIALSSNSASLKVPSSVTVASGTGSASFSATASAVAANTTATLTAAYNGVTKTLSEQLLAPVLSSFTCSPISFTPPATVSCTVGLSGPASGTGAAVALSSNSASLPVPASVVVAANATSANFNSVAATVSATTSAVLTASYNGVSRTVTETLQGPVAPPTLSTLACSPTTLNAGAASTCTVTLNKAATSATAVTLSSSNSAVGVPGSVSIASGASSTTFVAQAGSPTTTQTATLTAAAGGVSKTAALTVNPVVPGGGGGTGIAYVQSAKYNNDGGGTSMSATLANAVKAGNTLIVVVSWGDKNAPSLTASDDAGNVYKIATSAFDSRNRQGLAILYALNAKAGASKTTVSLGANLGYHRLIVTEYSGISSLDKTAMKTGTSTTSANSVTSGNVTTTAANELIFGAVMDDAGQNNITAGSGFTQRSYVNNKDLACQDKIQAAAGSTAATFTFSTRHDYLAQVVTFKAK